MSHTKQSLLGRCTIAFILAFACVGYAAKVEIECIESNPATGTSMATVLDASPLAHTTQVFPLDKKGGIAPKDDVRKQTEQALKNLAAVLKEGESGLNKIVKLNVYLRNATLRPEVEKVLAEQFNGKVKPAVTFVAGGLANADALIALDAVGVSELEATSTKMIGQNPAIPGVANVAILPKRGAVYVAGMADKGTIAEATQKTMEKLKGAIEHMGLGLKDVVQLKAFIDPISKVDESRAAIVKFFGGEPVPPIVFVEWVSSSVPIEIELIAASPEKHEKADGNIHYLTPPGTTASAVYSRIAHVCGGRRIYLSGLYGKSAPENDAKEIYDAIDGLLKKAGSDFHHLAKATYYWSFPSSNARLDALRPTIYNPKTPPTASKARVKDVGLEGKGITIDMIGVSTK